MRAPLLLCATLLVSACGDHRCKDNTVLLRVDLAGSAIEATQLNFSLRIDGGPAKAQQVPHLAGDPSGTIEIQFPQGYTVGSKLKVTVNAIVGGSIVVGMGDADTEVTLAAGCTNASLGIGGNADLAGLDLSGVDLTLKSAAPGQACDGATTCLNGATCVDGVCCTSACAGQCEACNVPSKEGTCSPVLGNPAGMRPQCTGAGDPVCGGSCDGATGATCTYKTVSCRAASCAAGVETAAASCAVGMCPAAVTASCANTGKVCGLNACSSVAQLVAGYDYTCARLADTSARCWGQNAAGQLGLGAGMTATTKVPTAVPGLVNVTKLAASRDNNGATCALLADQTVKCWGSNAFGALGRGTVDANDHGDPQPVLAAVATTLTGVTDFALGRWTACFVLGGGVKCLGSTFYGVAGQNAGVNTQVLFPTQVTNLTANYSQVSAGGTHACAVNGANNTSTPYCWGSNNVGQLGTGATGTTTTTPAQVPGMASITNALLPRAVETSLGDVGCAIDNTSVLKCWGSNTHGRLGRNQTAAALPNSPTPAKVCTVAACTASGEYLAQVKSVCGGDYHLCALRDPGGNAGQVWCWGESSHGQLGDGLAPNANDIIVANQVTLPAAAAEVACGAFHTCARLVDGRVYCWGWDADGELGINGGVTDKETPQLVSFP